MQFVARASNSFQKLLGIDVIIAGSFSETYKRNAFNNGLLCIEIPDLVLQMKINLAQAQKQSSGWECSQTLYKLSLN